MHNPFLNYKNLDEDVKDWTTLKVIPTVRYNHPAGQIEIENHLGWTKMLDIRAWGMLTGGGHGGLGLEFEQAEEIQRAWGNAIVDALNNRTPSQLTKDFSNVKNTEED